MYSRGERRRVLRGISRAVPLALAVALIALAGGARAQEGGTAEGAGTEGQPLVTNMFYETSLRQALADIAAQTGTIIVPDMSVQGLVTCELKDVPLGRWRSCFRRGSSSSATWMVSSLWGGPIPRARRSRSSARPAGSS